jgi:hypothetical protein
VQTSPPPFAMPPTDVLLRKVLMTAVTIPRKLWIDVFEQRGAIVTPRKEFDVARYRTEPGRPRRSA